MLLHFVIKICRQSPELADILKSALYMFIDFDYLWIATTLCKMTKENIFKFRKGFELRD